VRESHCRCAYAPDVYDVDRDVAWRVRLQMGLLLVGVVVAFAVFLFGVWGFNRTVIGARVTDCHFDAQGAYAKVRVNNLLKSSAHTKRVEVDFYSKSSHGPSGTEGTVSVTVPAHGHGTGVVRAELPLQSILVDPKFKGRTIYVAGSSTGGKLVTKQLAMKHPRKVRIETVPEDPNWLSCSIGEVTEDRADTTD
jgi:hypothetical protein